MTNLYQSDVRALSDEELTTLSGELEEAYCHSGYDDSYWCDDAAEARHDELRAEIRRRWEIANPEQAAESQKRRAFMDGVTLSLFECFKKNLEIARLAAADAASVKEISA